jgi:hypothetical protein
MNAAEIIAGLAVLGAIAAIAAWAQGRGRPADLGSVSHQWLSEQRLSQTQDEHR